MLRGDLCERRLVALARWTRAERHRHRARRLEADLGTFVGPRTRRFEKQPDANAGAAAPRFAPRGRACEVCRPRIHERGVPRLATKRFCLNSDRAMPMARSCAGGRQVLPPEIGRIATGSRGAAAASIARSERCSFWPRLAGAAVGIDRTVLVKAPRVDAMAGNVVDAAVRVEARWPMPTAAPASPSQLMPERGIEAAGAADRSRSGRSQAAEPDRLVFSRTDAMPWRSISGGFVANLDARWRGDTKLRPGARPAKARGGCAHHGGAASSKRPRGAPNEVPRSASSRGAVTMALAPSPTARARERRSHRSPRSILACRSGRSVMCSRYAQVKSGAGHGGARSMHMECCAVKA